MLSAPADRLGVAALTKMHVGGVDLRPLWHSLITKLIDGTVAENVALHARVWEAVKAALDASSG